MVLEQLTILNYKNIREATLRFSDKINCFVGLNGQGKTNLLDAVYLLSFTKSAFSVIDSQNITHNEPFAMVQGTYQAPDGDSISITCGIKRGQKKQFRIGQKDYKRLLDHIGLIPLVMVSPQDSELIAEGSDERRRFMDVVISQTNHSYLEDLTRYNALLKQRNAVLKQINDDVDDNDNHNVNVNNADSLLSIYEMQMVPLAENIYRERTRFVEAFMPLFNELYQQISGNNEQVSLRYVSQLQDRQLSEAYVRTRQRDIILGWTSQGIHKDDIEMLLDTYPLKRVGSQGQQKTYLLAMKLAQAIFLSSENSISPLEERVPEGRKRGCILLLDDIFDKLDKERVGRIVEIISSPRFGQIFITDTDRQHLSEILRPSENAKIFHVDNGQINE